MGQAEAAVIGHYLIPQDRWYALRVVEVLPEDGCLRVFADRVDLDDNRQPRETNVHKNHQITVRQVAPGVLREPENDWSGPRYWRVRAPLGQMALF